MAQLRKMGTKYLKRLKMEEYLGAIIAWKKLRPSQTSSKGWL
jgi:hypothetical protein